jgi:hypothetical protein
MAHDTFQVGDLTAVIGDNEGYGSHRAGYNGIHQLTHKSEPASIFVPGYVGLNLEHIMDGDQELRDVEGDRRVFFEPRNAPMTFKRLSESAAELHQEPTPSFFLESWTRFELVAPHYIDFTFRCKPSQHAFRNQWFGLFWASYINAPHDKSMYFRHHNHWLQLCTPVHNNQSTVVHKDNDFELKFTKGLTGNALFKNYSPLRFEDPFFYGLFREQVFQVMFDRTEGIRFTHSPSGGGYNREAQTTNPAWDFQFIVPEYEVLQEYGFKARVAYRPRCDRAELQREYANWRKFLDG